MLKTLTIAAAVLFMVWPAQARYVRKTVKPDFFMPEAAMPQPERLPMPVYRSGEEETVKRVEREIVRPQAAIDPSRSTIVDVPGYNGAGWKPKHVNGSSFDEEPEEETAEEIPSFQQKYDAYSRDLDRINSRGELPANRALDDDLAQMNSDERRSVVPPAYQPRNSRANFQRALNNSLNSN